MRAWEIIPLFYMALPAFLKTSFRKSTSTAVSSERTRRECLKADIEIARRLGCTKLTSTADLRLAMTAAIRTSDVGSTKEFDPRKYLGPARTNVKELVRAQG